MLGWGRLDDCWSGNRTCLLHSLSLEGCVYLCVRACMCACVFVCVCSCALILPEFMGAYYTSLSSDRTYGPISRQFNKTEFFVCVWVKAIGCILLTTNRTHLSRHLCQIEIEGCVCVCGGGAFLKKSLKKGKYLILKKTHKTTQKQ